MNTVLYPRRLEWNLCLVFTKSVILHILFLFCFSLTGTLTKYDCIIFT